MKYVVYKFNPNLKIGDKEYFYGRIYEFSDKEMNTKEFQEALSKGYLKLYIEPAENSSQSKRGRKASNKN